MAPLGQEVDVGVIDEIQMIGNPQRGWAWTRAVLGARARELHLCGEERVVPLIRELVASMGDDLVMHHYGRLNPLRAMSTSLKGNLKNLQKGDCVVAFSRITIHALKQEIERATGRRAAIVYGSLPAEIRSQQADLFNDPDNDYDFLVASDAIGMGLNL
jgi:ATP-dependent RNA helicase SUPV3L1/SUV3